MGCVSSKQAVIVTPAADYSGGLRETSEVGNAASYSLHSRVDSEKSSAKVYAALGGELRRFVWEGELDDDLREWFS